jgi:hypothetical protein
MMWWWTAAAASLTGDVPPEPAVIEWRGGADAIRRIRGFAERWRSTLAALTPRDLEVASLFPWGPDAERTVEDTVLWLNVELTKNAAEIGQLRLLRAARR